MENKKQCSKCKEWKDLEEFSKDSNTKDGLGLRCKSCCKEYYDKNKSKNLLQKKEYYIKNREKILSQREKYRPINKECSIKYGKEWRKNNKEYSNEYSKKHRNLFMVYDLDLKSLNDLMLYEEVKESYSGNVECKCTYCGSWFEPTRSQIYNRTCAVNGTSSRECRLYCSEGCKFSCPIYGQVKYPKNYKKASPDEVDPELRKMVLVRDEYQCVKCGKSKDEVELHCHHITGKVVNQIESLDMDNCVTFCKKCHLLAHKEKGCTYYDLRCKTKL